MLPVGLARKRCSALAAVIAAPASLLLTPGRAEALLIYNIFDSGSNEVTLQASGSIKRPSLTAIPSTINCSVNGSFNSSSAVLCLGPSLPEYYPITGNTSFSPSGISLSTSNFSGLFIILNGATQRFYIQSSYADNDPIVSSAIFSGTSLNALGLTTPGLIASWQLDGVSGDDGKIELRVGPPAEVPAPLPLFGAAAAFGWSRTLRRRLRASTPSNA